MATQTSFLKLVLPLNGEYRDVWDGPINDNFTKIDTWADAIEQELVGSRFGESTLQDFLAISHNIDGTLKPTDEVVKARSSIAYGDEFSPGNDFELGDRINEGDKEVLTAREGYPTIRDGLAARALSVNQVVRGSANVNGYPSWLGFTGPNAQVDGSVDPLWLMIDGYLCRVRTLKQVTISGGSGTKYLYAQFDADGEIVVDGDSSSAPPASANGTTGTDTSKIRLFQDLTVDFSSENVQAGDLLEIVGGANDGKYQIDEVAPGSNNNRLKIKGVFPGGTLSSLDYNVIDPVGVSLGFDAVQVPATGKFYIAEIDYDGAAITAVRPIHFKDTFVGEWRSVDVSSGPGTFEEIWNHNLLDDALDISVQVSQANDGSLPIEELSLSSLTSTLGVSINNGLIFSAGTFDPGTSDASYSPLPSLTGSITGSTTGAVNPDRSVRMQWTKTQVYVKNLIATKFYVDYTNAARQSGFLRVVIRKRRA